MGQGLHRPKITCVNTHTGHLPSSADQYQMRYELQGRNANRVPNLGSVLAIALSIRGNDLPDQEPDSDKE